MDFNQIKQEYIKEYEDIFSSEEEIKDKEILKNFIDKWEGLFKFYELSVPNYTYLTVYGLAYQVYIKCKN